MFFCSIKIGEIIMIQVVRYAVAGEGTIGGGMREHIHL
jgi:hypothetical protein